LTTSRDNIGRNDLCPCGSGRKYKHCHLGKAFDDQIEQHKADNRIPLALLVFALILAGVVGAMNEPSAGGIVLLASLMGIGGFMVLRKPPGPSEHGGGGDGAGINFGR
jgi:hypothetical protein